MKIEYRRNNKKNGSYTVLGRLISRKSEHDFYFSKFTYRIGNKTYTKFEGEFEEELKKIQTWERLRNDRV